MTTPKRATKFSCAIAFTALMGLNIAAAHAAPPSGKTALLVQPKAGLPEHVLDRLISLHGAEIVDTIKGINVKIIHVPERAATALSNALKNSPHIEFVEQDEPLSLNAVTNDPEFSNQWHHTKIQNDYAWDKSSGDAATIAILDTGVDSSHPDLSGNIISGWNSVSKSSDTSDIMGHGTKVAGAAAAVGNNSTGVAGVAWNANIMPVRVTNTSDGLAYPSDIANGLIWAVDNGADVANISYNVSGSSTVISAGSYARKNNAIVVVAAGNSGSSYSYSDSDSLIAVSATTSSDSLASWSSYGNYVDVSAPGANIRTTTNGGGYAYVNGTSFASPVTAGVTALIKSANPSLSPSQIESVLEEGAEDKGSTGLDSLYGHGRINSYNSVQLALNTSATDFEAPSVQITAPTAGEVSGIANVDVYAADNVGVREVALYINGKLHATDVSAPYQFSWDSTTSSDGNTSVRAEATDEAGNLSSHSVSISVANSGSVGTFSNISSPVADEEAPIVTILSPYQDEQFTGGRFQATAIASDNISVTAMACYFDGSQIATSTSGDITCNIQLRKVSIGAHTVRFEAIDGAGNRAAEEVIVHLVADSTSGGSTDSGTTDGTTKGGKGSGKGNK